MSCSATHNKVLEILCDTLIRMLWLYAHFSAFFRIFITILFDFSDLILFIFADIRSPFSTATSSHVCCTLPIASDRPIKQVDSERYNHHPVPAHLRINYQIWIATFAIGRAFVLTLPFTLFIVFPIDFRLPISSFLCFKFFHLSNLVLKFLYIKHDLSYQ